LNTKFDTIIIGGGASGLISAIVATRKGEKTLLIEKMPQLGMKLRITGKGRCNITNTLPLKEFILHCGSEPRFLYPAFNLFFNKELIKFLEDLGLKTQVERGNRVFPQSERALDVFLALVSPLEASSLCKIIKNTSVTRILKEENKVCGVEVIDKNISKKQKYFADKIILAAGGESYPQTGSNGGGVKLAQDLGHTIIKTYPSLVGFKLDNYNPSQESNDFEIKNVSLSVTTLTRKKIFQDFGDVVFRNDGIDGPIVLKASRNVTTLLHKDDPLNVVVDFKPKVEKKQLEEEILQTFSLRGKENIEDVLRAFIPKELIPLLENNTNVDIHKQASLLFARERKEILSFLKQLTFQTTSTFGFDRAISTQGGVSLKEINPKTLQSKIVKGLYFAGEVMDLDADTGGFNLQIAFSTGYLAGLTNE
jgi:predicted Rossmann fold flavoprotein